MVIDLLNQGVSYRKIQVLSGVSRGTVSNIANGKVTIESSSESRRERRKEESQSPVEFVGPPVRCPECGRLVYPPCMACRIAKETKQAACIDDFADSYDREISSAFRSFANICEGVF